MLTPESLTGRHVLATLTTRPYWATPGPSLPPELLETPSEIVRDLFWRYHDRST